MKYEARINTNDFYTVIVMIHTDGYEQVIHGYKGRHFSSLKAAEKSTSAYIAKHLS